MINNKSSFLGLLKNDPDLEARAQEVAAQYIAEAATRGVNLTLDDCYGLSAVRIHAITGQRVVDNWWTEAEELIPAAKKAAEEREMMEAITDVNGDLKRKAEAEAALEEELSKLKPAEKMRRARELGQRLPGPKKGEKKKAMTAEEKAHALAELERLPVAMKLARYREIFGE